jgi:hypothetical protein
VREFLLFGIEMSGARTKAINYKTRKCLLIAEELK